MSTQPFVLPEVTDPPPAAHVATFAIVFGRAANHGKITRKEKLTLDQIERSLREAQAEQQEFTFAQLRDASDLERAELKWHRGTPSASTVAQVEPRASSRLSARSCSIAIR